MAIPETRQSLIARVRDEQDAAAWAEFVSIYRPAVFRFALRRGLQLADAEDVTQRVFVAVARAMQDWQTERRHGSFRAWLLLVTRNQVHNALARAPRVRAAGGTSMLDRLRQVASRGQAKDAGPRAGGAATDLFDWEAARAEFRRAAEDIRGEFAAHTWAAFWMSTVEGRSVRETATALEQSSGSIYAARSRVMRRLRQRVETVRRQHDRP